MNGREITGGTEAIHRLTTRYIVTIAERTVDSQF
jgi:hypothetical protein